VVPEDIDKELAEQFARNVEGVTEVDNQLEIDADYVRPDAAETRSFGDRITDATITATVKSKLMWSRHAEGLATEVSTESGKVTLEGTAESEAARDLAGRLAADTRGVESVDNQLEVREPDTAKEPGAGEARLPWTRPARWRRIPGTTSPTAGSPPRSNPPSCGPTAFPEWISR
jgi:hyperosmotically inducible periplasmic protein